MIVLLYIERKKKWKSCFCFFTDRKQHKERELYMTLSVHDMFIVLSAAMMSWGLIPKIHCTLSTNQKGVQEFNV